MTEAFHASDIPDAKATAGKTPIALFRQLGPGLVTGAADDDPSGIATYSQTGAQFGFGLLWTLTLTYPLMCAVQLISARIGRVTGRGLAANMGAVLPRWVVLSLVASLFAANTINIAADLAAMGSAAALVAGWGDHVFTVLFAVISLGLQLFVPYRRYVSTLKWLTLSLFAYVGVLLMVRVEWVSVARNLVWPGDLKVDAWVTIVAIFGTTISPYLFFWQCAQEVEDLRNDPCGKPLVDAPAQAKPAFARIRWDTMTGMAISNLVAISIMIGTAATLHASGKTSINTAADAAEALKPIAGEFAFALFALGIIGTGLLAVPVLAGASAYAMSEAGGWKGGLADKPPQALGFYSVVTVAILLAIALDWSPVDPIKALFWSAVINGVVSVPILAAMMLVVTRPSVMGQFRADRRLMICGTATTVVMAVAAGVMVFTL